MHSSFKKRAGKVLAGIAASSLLLGTFSTGLAQSRTDMRVVDQERHRGIVSLYEALTPLKSVGSFMTVGAHPDDERSSQIALLSRGMGVRSITVTANRGEGGQNSMGTEYTQALGVTRSREMEESSAAFNVELYFLSESFDDPIIDFRFSKSAAETLEIWGEDVVMEKIVRAVRESRPDILFANFQNVFGQHGHHRVAAWAAEQAFEMAGDPEVFPEHLEMGLEAWQPKKLYLPSGTGGAQGDDPEELETTLTLDTGAYNEFFGATYDQLGQQSRAYHRTQDMGSWQVERDSVSNLHLRGSHVNTAEEDDALFADLAFTVADLADGLEDETLVGQLNDIQASIDEAFDVFPDFAAVQVAVSDALVSVRDARETLADLDDDAIDEETRNDLDFRLSVKDDELEYASQAALSLVTRVTAETPELIRGGSTDVTVTAYVGGGTDVD
ncbi:MAG TPA: PIG-L family deacetylase, partial [Deinococcales bacterium]|nr:PIG-L family deacetylase [Deinococcales bacterium]